MAEKFPYSVSLLSWGLNEEKLLEKFLDRAFAMMDEYVSDFEIIFVNDGSTDLTGEIAERYMRREPRLRVIHNEKNLNVGLSCRRAIEAARKDFLFWQVVDWAYDLEQLPIFLDLLHHYDVVQGIRPTPERILSHIPIIRSIYRVSGRSDTLWKAVVSLSNYYVQRMIFAAPFHDFQNVTFYRTSMVQSLPLQAKTPFINPELLIRTYYKKMRFIEVPIPFIPRKEGEGKGTKLPILLRTVSDIIKNGLLWGVQMRMQNEAGTIHRVAEPFHLEDEVLRKVLPLFKYYR
ncbi:glycosyltransferase family 2 protein [Magnetococcales bacterium HHB-1]